VGDGSCAQAIPATASIETAIAAPTSNTITLLLRTLSSFASSSGGAERTEPHPLLHNIHNSWSVAAGTKKRIGRTAYLLSLLQSLFSSYLEVGVLRSSLKVKFVEKSQRWAIWGMRHFGWGA
jgi:hypothetical protein